ncbi:RNA-binding protein 14 isoform X2 [Mixophyes fleayi]|uniref:RNA-binding protein 14 isoform X2 n=1 Tax=Mixophyes fleayi TaxID=3061075 RepID=UPI003F4E4486
MRDTMKIFIGNVDDRTTQEELSELFEKHGTVVSCAVMKHYAFVHMRGTDRAMKAIEALNGWEVNGKKMVVELSKPRPQNTWKIFIGNVGSDCEVSEIRSMFEVYGRVVECDVVKDYAFVHMERESEAKEAIENLNGKEIKGKRINVEMSNKTQKPLSSNGNSNSSRSRRSHEYREIPQSRSEAYNRRRAPEAAYVSYALKSPYERYAGDPALYDAFESRARPPSPMYYSRDRSPLRRPPPIAYYDAVASKYRSQPSGYSSLSSAYEGQPASSFSSAYGSQSSTLSSAYGSRASALASGYGNQAGYDNKSSTYGTETPSSYGSQTSAVYGTQPSSLSATYASQLSSVAPSYASQSSSSAFPSHTATSTFASSSALGGAYRQQQSSAYETSQITGLGSQPAYSSLPAATDAPIYERTRLSPPRSTAADGYKKSADGYKRLASDRRFSELSDYRRLTQESQDPFRRSPPKSQLDYRRTPELHSDYSQYSSYSDYTRAAQISGYSRRL